MVGLAFSPDLVVISDVHLRGLDSPRGRLFLDMLETLATLKVRHLCFLGDIFDFCFGIHRRWYSNAYRPLQLALEKIKGTGARIYFVEGNHEFSIDALGWTIDVVTEGDLVIDLGDGDRVAVCHGDRFDRSLGYRLLRQTVRSRWARTVAGALPPQVLYRFALINAHSSRTVSQYSSPKHHRILPEATAWLFAQSASTRVGVFGHFHHPYAETVRDPVTQEVGRLYSVHSWDQPSLLAFRRLQVSRCAVRERGTLEVLES